MTNLKEKESKIAVPRITIKWIKGKPYVYTWYYINKAERADKKQRFKWIYVGPLSGKGGEYIQSYSVNEKAVKEEMMERRKLGQFKIRRSVVSSLPRTEKRRLEIEEIRKSNPSLAKEMSNKLYEDIQTEATEFVEVMFQGFTAESFHEYLAAGGSVEGLYEEAKKEFR